MTEGAMAVATATVTATVGMAMVAVIAAIEAFFSHVPNSRVQLSTGLIERPPNSSFAASARKHHQGLVGS